MLSILISSIAINIALIIKLCSHNEYKQVDDVMRDVGLAIKACGFKSDCDGHYIKVTLNVAHKLKYIAEKSIWHLGTVANKGDYECYATFDNGSLSDNLKIVLEVHENGYFKHTGKPC